MNSSELSVLFSNPGCAYRAKPFWSWNGELREDEVRRQVGIMQDMGFGGFFMHSRAGLITEYLGREWFDLINAGADEGERRGLEAWLYDEDRWPSGSAGGKVTVDPQYRMKSLCIAEMPPERFAFSDDVILAFAAKLDGINLYDYFPIAKTDDPAAVFAAAESRCTGKPGVWRALAFQIVPDQPDSNYNGTTYIDTMSEKATRRFIELTHEQYAAHCGDRLGRSIKGIFTDEPHRGHGLDNRCEEDGVITCAMAWTDDLFSEFEKRYGYDACAVLPELFYRKDGERFAPVKHDYLDLCDNLFLERFAKPLNDWCIAHNIQFTGHVLHEDSLTNQAVPHGSLMRFYAYMGIPGIDILTEGNRCYWVVKQLASAARQLGKKWMLSELYGCTGWQMSMKSHKAIGDWQALFGINLRCPHLSWYTMEGESKRDYPASILHQSTWYPYYGAVEGYFARFGALMTEGTPCCDVLVLNPVESAWSQAYLGWAAWISPTDPDVQQLERRYQETFHMLTDRHIDFDYGEEQMMAQYGAVEQDADGRPALRIGEMVYHVVVVSGLETIRPSTLRLLRDFMAIGGCVIFAGDVPAYVDGARSEAPAQAASNAVCVPFDGDCLAAAVQAAASDTISVETAAGEEAKDVFIQMRRYGDSVGFVLLNTDRDHPTGELTVRIPCGQAMHVELWDMASGQRFRADRLAGFENGILSIHTSLDAAGTSAFVLTQTADQTLPLLPAAEKTLTEITVTGDVPYRLSEKNVCVLDFARWKWADGTWSDEIEILKADQAVRDSIGIEHRGGSMLQPWFSKLHDRKIYGQLEVEFTFDIETMPESDLILAGERPENLHYRLNGHDLAVPDCHDFWIDDCFKCMQLPRTLLKVGRNTVSYTVDFMRTTNLEALYLIGDFGVCLDGHRRTLTTLPERIGNLNLESYRLPFYTGEVTYLFSPETYAHLDLSGAGHVYLSPTAFTGALVKVAAEGEDGEQLLLWDPYEADVTDAVRAKQTIAVTVVGTRHNVFGPLHLVPAIQGAYGPGSFLTSGSEWSNDYVLTDSALCGVTFSVRK